MSKLDKILGIENTRCYYDDMDIDKEKYDKLEDEIESALKLQEFVKEEIDLFKYKIKYFVPEWEVSTYTLPILQSNLQMIQHLLKESENGK